MLYAPSAGSRQQTAGWWVLSSVHVTQGSRHARADRLHSQPEDEPIDVLPRAVAPGIALPVGRVPQQANYHILLTSAEAGLDATA
jgi:hypothetical protein